MAGQKNSKYKPEYCEALIECLSEGHSIGGFAGKIRVGERTVFDWLDKHPEFAEAYEIAKPASLFAWEKTLIAFSKSGKGNAVGIIFGLHNRGSAHWRQTQKVEHEHTGKNGGAIAHSVEVTFVEAGE
jgi:hypothetical protein